ncbi:helix-turn-helix domain-containing protein [Paenibacillus nasutitermitis]|uniref:AraC family transcriptional regulator n=1 Tax=Paenibacillus nasutitermitis TaxID=1652958 RepID=A0A916YMX0_9BACL|nr:helix-turn-helix domain-containing protein [Paenibacillus nasutitermitis]GGD52971.1 AraC family transcriptional regulator [Paenibacillus nasutitermitis]
MRLPGKAHKSNIYKRFLVSFLLMLIIPIMLSSFTYYEAVNIVETQSREAKLSVLEQTRDLLDKQWKDMDEASIQLSFDSRLNGLFNVKAPLDNSPVLFDIWNYYKDFRSMALTGGAFTNTVFVVLKNSDLVFSKAQTTDSTREFYSDVFHYDGVSYEEWHALLFDKSHFREVLPSRQARVNGVDTSVIIYMTSLPLGATQESQAVVVFAIEDNDIRKLAGIDGENGHTFAILDDKGELLMGDTNVPIPAAIRSSTERHGYMHAKIGGEDHLFVYTRSGNNNWVYVASVPIEQVMGNVYYIRTIALSVAAGTLVVGTIISLWMANRHSKPWKEIVSVLRAFWGQDQGVKHELVGLPDKPNEVDFLQKSITRLIDNNLTLEQSLQRQADTLKTVFIERLFRGEFEDRSQMQAMLAHVGLELRGSGFAIAVLHIYKINVAFNPESLEEQSILRALMEEVVQEQLQGDGHLHTMHENELVILIRSDLADKTVFVTVLEALFTRISQQIRERYVIAPMIGVGEIYDDLFDVHYSYQEAKQAVTDTQTAGGEEPAVVWYAQMKNRHTGYYYPTELEIRLMNVVKAGNAAELEHLLQHLHHENFAVRSLSPVTNQHLLGDLQATERKLKDELGGQLPSEAADPGPVPAFVGYDKDLQDMFFQFLQLCRSIEKNKKSRNSRLMDEIVAHIDEHFQDANLSLYAIASHFNLSESYLSQFFKEQSGEKFSSYLENRRISLACKLIVQDTQSIDSIAVQTGYNSTHSFRRAFKRTMGVSPSSYKQL